MPSSLSRRHGLQQWGVLIGVALVLPFVVTYLHLYSVLQAEECRVVVASQNEQQPAMVCRNNKQVQLSSAPPSIAVFASRIQDVKRGGSGRRIPSAQAQQTTEDTILLDYSIPLCQRIWQQAFSFLPTSPTTSTTASTAEESVAVNKYGFRSNNNNKGNTSSNRHYLFLLPLATYFFLAVNIGLFLLYKMKKVTVTTVALNSQMVSKSDLGRAITGNLAHFEPWHLFFNMMTTQSIGSEILEGRLGTLPLFLYTVTWIPVTTTVVIGLYALYHKWRVGSSSNNSTTGGSVASIIPNMVGFSGILFVWMVLATLQASNQQSCPIFFFPSLCFETFSVLGMFSINLGPVVQLVFLQVILPRASFAGHLAGLLVGFIWHWLLQWNRNHLSSGFLLEWTQPCILYPILWGIAKYMTATGKFFVSSDDTNNDTTAGGNTLGGGHVLGGSGARNSRLLWTLDGNQLDDDDHANNNNNHNQGGESDSTAAFRCLSILRNGMILHTACLLFLFGTSSINSMILSQCMLLGIVTAILNDQNNTNIGMLGRGYVVMVLIVAVTDVMTLAGWAVTSMMWQRVWPLFLCILMIRLLVLWGVSLSLVCYLLELQDQLQQQPSSVWYHALQWWVLQPCKSMGKLMVQTLSKRMNTFNRIPIAVDDDSHSAANGNRKDPGSHTKRGRVVSEVV